MKGIPAQHQERQPGRERLMEPAPDFMPRYAGSARLEGKAALITGGDSGIGRAVAVLFAREGADVAVVFREESEDARETRRLVEAEGRHCLLIEGDVAEEEFCRRAVALTVERLGRLDVLVNNAAEQHPREALEDISAEQLARTFATNLFGYVFMAKAALPHLGKGAAIVNTTSVTAYRGSFHLIDYASTKGAIVAFTRSLAQAVADRGIRVNAVAPGPIWTPLIPASFDAEHVATFGKNVPMGRPGQPAEVAPCHLFLACEDSSYMTGQVLHPNGGEIVGG
ncbi:SDR family oxidoreductase [Marinimicrococcus flavescens]|uniref:SDR family oxidoreductase n=1 Tax=Marinimicrococcus flavescens TaxID=3031815 RepID=A0AAP3UZH2_9PROT|nr:SDR family oxidoreductase [Marinimicrococcus flavescens]